MLKGTPLLHPEILRILASAGHGSKVLIADGNYPFSTRLGPNAKIVFLNLSPGVVTATQVLEVLVQAIPVEKVFVMRPSENDRQTLGIKDDPPIWEEFLKILHSTYPTLDLDKLERSDFYKSASSPDVALTIATGEEALFANILLTIGVVMPEQK